MKLHLPHLLHHGFVHSQLEQIHEHVEAAAGGHRGTDQGQHVPDSVFKELSAAIGDAREDGEASRATGAFYSRHPVVSIAQSAMHERLAQKAEAAGTPLGEAPIEHDDERMGDAFTKKDVMWIVEIGLSLLWGLVQRKHPFCDEPAKATLPDDARLVIFGDWGTGLIGAQHVAQQAAKWITDTDRPVHAIHLGDIYYSGTKREVRENGLKPWPVPAARAGEVGSWALNGNHDMYSGGHGLFEEMLGDPRFARQHLADGSPTSWFSLQSTHWNVVGLDTSWAPQLPHDSEVGHLHGSQGAHVAQCAADASRRLLLLSHHQLFTVKDEHTIGAQLKQALAPVLEGRGVDVWFWGHEHDCIAYKPHDGVTSARAIGHAAVPDVVAAPLDPLPEHVSWEFTDYRIGEDGEHWAKHGFAVADLDGDMLEVNHIDDEGHVYKTERLPEG